MPTIHSRLNGGRPGLDRHRRSWDARQRSTHGFSAADADDDGAARVSTSSLADGHKHVDRLGAMHECWHECTTEVKRPAFWALNALLTMLLFPFEHALYTHVIPFTWVTRFLGLD
ncbi:MAG: hypothetical protein KAY03_02905 [Arenimonas sp.]|nr:hypothetical protein [Arenimonas sp.]